MLDAIGQYKILDRIGADGLGEVYRGRDTRLGRSVAIRIVAPDLVHDPDRRERLLKEARAATLLSHPNIAVLYETLEDGGRLCLVSEFVPGETLEAVIGGRPMNPRRAIDLVAEIGDALAEAHAFGIVCQELRTDNVVVTPKGRAKLRDLGLSTCRVGSAGAAAYQSPEQALGQPVDRRTDIFSLGVVLFEMLTGTLPFGGSTPGEIAERIVQAPASPPSSVNATVPREVDPIVAKALAKNPDDRFDSAATLAAQLRSLSTVLGERTGSKAPAAALAPMPPARSYTGRVIVGLLIAALCLVAWQQRWC